MLYPTLRAVVLDEHGRHESLTGWTLAWDLLGRLRDVAFGDLAQTHVTCVLLLSGTTLCQGKNDRGQLGVPARSSTPPIIFERFRVSRHD